ncbi:MAG: SDR family oxidoreductase [Burkholderiaceae bacterium]
MKALVVGDTGMVGRYLTNQLLSVGQWQVCGLSRSGRSNTYTCLNADLSDGAAIVSALKEHRDISHVFYAGRSPDPDPQTECDTNTRMFVNLVQAMDEAGVRYEHIQLMQGLKWYGSQAGPWRTPAREDDPRHDSPNFYYDQHDWLLAHQRTQSKAHGANRWHWSAVRPHQVAGFSDTYPHNIAGVIALYGSFCSDQGASLDFPGTRACYESLSMLMDATLMARAMIFIATSPKTRNKAFNIGNGDYFRWQNLWPVLADFFKVPCGQVTDISLEDRFGGQGAQWRAICDRHQLAVPDMNQIGNWRYGDFSFRAGWDDMADINAIRKSGFSEWRDSEQVLLNTLQQYRSERIIP